VKATPIAKTLTVLRSNEGLACSAAAVKEQTIVSKRITGHRRYGYRYNLAKGATDSTKNLDSDREGGVDRSRTRLGIRPRNSCLEERLRCTYDSARRRRERRASR